MDHFEEIYTRQAAAYHRMIQAEDADGNLLAALERLLPLDGARVLDLGTGSGRLPLLLHGRAAALVGLDRQAAMLAENRAQRARAGGAWSLVQGDLQALPFPDGWAELVTAGWAIGHLRSWFAGDWQAHIGRAMQEMHRVARPGGSLVLLETLTTGSLAPAPPTPELAEYYAWLEREWGFTRQVIRTDYVFESVERAAANLAFFFGAELAERVRANRWRRVPEWTGVWSKITGAA